MNKGITQQISLNLSALLDGERLDFPLPIDGDYSKGLMVALNGQILVDAVNYRIVDYSLVLSTTPPKNGENLVVYYYLTDEYTLYLNDLIAAVVRQGRFDRLDTMICPINRDEIIDAIYNALDDINTYPPQTFFSLQDVMSQKDTRWKRILILRATANCIDNLLYQWTADGIDVVLGEFQVQDKTSAYQTLFDTMQTKFDDLLTKLKTASQNFSTSRTYDPSLGFGRWGSTRFMYKNWNNSRI